VLFLAFLSIALFAFVFFQRSSLSNSDIALSIEGPQEFKAQEAVEFEIVFENRSRAEIHGAALFVAIPEFLSFDDLDTVEQKIDLGVVMPHSKTSRKISLFSKETQKEGTIKVRAEYSPGGIEGKFEKAVEYEVSVSSLPLTVIFDIPQKAVNGQRIHGAFHFVSDRGVESLPLFAKIILPSGFALEDSEPIPYEDTIWRFDKIEPETSYQVEFEGVIRGEESEEKNFQLLFGHMKEDGSFAEQYITSRIISISSAPIEFTQMINGEEQYIASPGDDLNFSIRYANKSGVDIEDITVTVQLTGDIFDLGKLNAGLGYFNKNTRTIVWNKNFLQKLARLNEEDGGEINFSVPIKKDITPKNYKDKNIYGVSHALIESSKVPLALKGLSLRAEDEAKIKIRTQLALFQRAYYYEGPFSNSGPIPPRVGEKTIYTILWQITNTLNDANGVKLEAPLPRHVVFEGEVYPLRDNFKYNKDTHSVSWDIGALSSGIGNIFPVETIAFQVSVTPQDNMRGKTFELIEQSKISGTDTFTEEFLEKFASSVDSSLPDDIGIREGDGVVQ